MCLAGSVNVCVFEPRCPVGLELLPLSVALVQSLQEVLSLPPSPAFAYSGHPVLHVFLLSPLALLKLSVPLYTSTANTAKASCIPVDKHR